MKEKYKLNVFNKPLEICSEKPLTGYFRDGCCSSAEGDHGKHYVCSHLSEQFLIFSQKKGNDLITPRPEYLFEGLKPDDRWCICLDRWIEAYEAGVAPKLILKSTNKLCLKKINIEILKKFSLDIN